MEVKKSNKGLASNDTYFILITYVKVVVLNHWNY